MWDPLTPKYLQKYKNKKKSGKKKTNENENPIRTSRGTLNTCAKFQGLMSQKRRGHLDSEGIWVYMLEPAYTVKLAFPVASTTCTPYLCTPGPWQAPGFSPKTWRSQTVFGIDV